MSRLLGIARFRFKEGRVEEFKHLSRRCLEVVRERDTGTLRYDIFLNADESEALVIEEYADTAAPYSHSPRFSPRARTSSRPALGPYRGPSSST